MAAIHGYKVFGDLKNMIKIRVHFDIQKADPPVGSFSPGFIPDAQPR